MYDRHITKKKKKNMCDKDLWFETLISYMLWLYFDNFLYKYLITQKENKIKSKKKKIKVISDVFSFRLTIKISNKNRIESNGTQKFFICSALHLE